MQYKKQQAGFTLIELLVVISIIGIISSFVLVNLTRVRLAARDSQRKTDVKTLQSAAELFYNSPASGQGPSYPGGTGDTLKNSLTSPIAYIQPNNWPTDPQDKTSYSYTPSPGGCAPGPNSCLSYILWACLENTNDQLADKNRPGFAIQSCPAQRYSHTVISP